MNSYSYLRQAKTAVQARSLDALERILDAAEAQLAKQGLAGATIPAIAERAQVATGTVYQRFHDKDALLRAVFLRFFAQAEERNRTVLDPGKWEGLALPQV